MILLAAGRGERLRPLTDDRPKALVEVGGEPVVVRALRTLADAGLQPVTAVTGWQADWFRDLDCRVQHNERWEENNIVSLWTVRDLVAHGCLIVNSDVIFAPPLAGRIASARGSALLCDGDRTLDDEAMKAELDGDGLLTRLSKQADPERSAGEYTGLARIDPADGPRLAEILSEMVEAGETEVYYENAIEKLAADRPVRSVAVGGEPWAEIDDHADLEWAEREVVPRV